MLTNIERHLLLHYTEGKRIIRRRPKPTTPAAVSIRIH
jgi:hypothetical protein